MSITTALKARREALADREAGFTLIELLVVVLIIGILAAIAIPVYLGVQNNAKDSGVQSDMASDKIALQAWATSNPTQVLFPALPLTATPTGESLVVKNNGFTYDAANYKAPNGAAPALKTGSTPTLFCLDAKSTQGTAFFVSTNKGVAKGSCSATTSTW